ncbi:hypothetical protein C8R45DRAFT_1109885 [Mycena sanguinolenta]|nr:hypothetical protein C8R45DRAFT_1109885 [Mycena sanguinolenta]
MPLLPYSNTVPTRQQPVSDSVAEKNENRRALHAAASARYRERNRQKVLEAGRVRVAECRARIKANPSEDKRARERVRLTSTRYCAQHCKELATKQRKVRRREFIGQYGVRAYVRRNREAPIRTRQPVMPEPEQPVAADGYDADEDEKEGEGEADDELAPHESHTDIWGYDDPFEYDNASI